MKQKLLILFIFIGLNVSYAAGNNVEINCKLVGINNINQCVLSIKNGNAPAVYAITNMPYALCSKALCTLTNDGKFANCKCELENYPNGWKSLSLSPTSYTSAKPTMDEKGNLQSVQSNYSMANITNFSQSANHQCKYTKPHPWANCYGVRCTVKTININEKNRQVANCVCPVNQATSYLIGTTGSSACHLSENKVWSATTGASLKVYGTNPMNILYKKLYPNSSPVKNM
ncbi:hypothetical protein KFE69_00300 [bacterium SCSIO 12844]|nr:hypothetical protein KFE69_00300 [bacterium SCSIO 12844]